MCDGSWEELLLVCMVRLHCVFVGAHALDSLAGAHALDGLASAHALTGEDDVVKTARVPDDREPHWTIPCLWRHTKIDQTLCAIWSQ